MSHLRIEIYTSGKVNGCKQIALAPLEVNLTRMTRMYIIKTRVFYLHGLDSDETSHTFSLACRSILLNVLVFIVNLFYYIHVYNFVKIVFQSAHKMCEH